MITTALYNPLADYNTLMNRWGVTAILLVVVLLATGGYLVYKVAQAVAGNYAAVALENSVFSPDSYPPEAQHIPAAEAQVRRAYERYGGWRLGWMLHDLLLLKAWSLPDSSVAPLNEALQLGQRYYPAIKGESDAWQNFIGNKIAWGYLYAALPEKLDAWGKSFVAATPSAYDSITLMRISAAVQRDDLAAAQDMARAEADKARTTPSNQALAIAAWMELGNIEQARRAAEGFAASAALDSYVKHYYAAYLMEQQRFGDALAVYVELFGARPDPDEALLLAAAQAGIHGLDDAQVRVLIETGARSSRNPCSVAGAEALVAAYVYYVTLDDKYLQRILALDRKHPEDYEVKSAQLTCGLLRLSQRYYDDAGQPRDRPQIVPGGTGLPHPAEVLEQVLRLAETPGQQQEALLLKASTLCIQAREADFDHALLLQAADALRQALGDPGVERAVVTERVPSYDSVLLDPAVRQARRADPAFDAALNAAVVDYLNRRRELFRDSNPGPALAYRASVAE